MPITLGKCNSHCHNFLCASSQLNYLIYSQATTLLNKMRVRRTVFNFVLSLRNAFSAGQRQLCKSWHCFALDTIHLACTELIFLKLRRKKYGKASSWTLRERKERPLCRHLYVYTGSHRIGGISFHTHTQMASYKG